MGGVIAKAYEKVGTTGSTTLEESQTLNDEVEFTEGLTIDRGYVSPYFVNDQERQLCELMDPKILVTDNKIENVNDLIPLLEVRGGVRRLPFTSSPRDGALDGLYFEFELFRTKPGRVDGVDESVRAPRERAAGADLVVESCREVSTVASTATRDTHATLRTRRAWSRPRRSS